VRHFCDEARTIGAERGENEVLVGRHGTILANG
jgi:hypothetical protein